MVNVKDYTRKTRAHIFIATCQHITQHLAQTRPVSKCSLRAASKAVNLQPFHIQILAISIKFLVIQIIYLDAISFLTHFIYFLFISSKFLYKVKKIIRQILHTRKFRGVKIQKSLCSSLHRCHLQVMSVSDLGYIPEQTVWQFRVENQDLPCECSLYSVCTVEVSELSVSHFSKAVFP